jgi:hypothetical protein
MRLLGVERPDQLGIQHVSVIFAVTSWYLSNRLLTDNLMLIDQHPVVGAAGLRWSLWPWSLSSTVLVKALE